MNSVLLDHFGETIGGDIGALCRNVETGLRDLYDLLGSDVRQDD
jgi:hypothetical protein